MKTTRSFPGLAAFVFVCWFSSSLFPSAEAKATDGLSITVTRSARANLHDTNGKKTGSTALQPGMQFELTHFDGKYYTVQVGPYAAKIPAKAASMDGAVQTPANATRSTSATSAKNAKHRERRPRKVQTPWRTVGGTTIMPSSYRNSSAGSRYGVGSETFTKSSERASEWRSVGGATTMTTPVPRRGSVVSSTRTHNYSGTSYSNGGTPGPWRSVGARFPTPPPRQSSFSPYSQDAPYVPRPLGANEIASEWKTLGDHSGRRAPSIDPKAVTGNRNPNLPLAKGPGEQPPPMATSWRYLGALPDLPKNTNAIQTVQSDDNPAPEGLIETIEPIPPDIIQETIMAAPTPSLGAPSSGTKQIVEPGSPHPSTHLRMPKDDHRNTMLPATLADKNGGVVQSTTLNGKIVGFYFTASWCGPCKVFTPPLIKFRDHYKDQFEIVMVGSDRSPEDHAAYMKKYNMPWPATEHGSFASRFLYERYGVASVPTLVIVRADGSTITTDGRTQLLDDPEAAFNDWQANSK